MLVLLLALAKLRTRRGLHPGSRPLAALCAATVPVLAAVSYILPLFVVKIGPWANDIGPGWLKKLDDLLTCRISLAWAAYRVFDIKIAGQMLPDWPALDNIFVYLLYLTGPVMVVLVCALMMTALYGYARRGQWQAVACLLVMLAYGYMESQVTHLTSDPALLLLCGAVFALPRERWMNKRQLRHKAPRADMESAPLRRVRGRAMPAHAASTAFTPPGRRRRKFPQFPPPRRLRRRPWRQ